MEEWRRCSKGHCLRRTAWGGGWSQAGTACVHQWHELGSWTCGWKALTWLSGGVSGATLLTTVYSSPIGFMEKAMASHSSTLAWKIPWTEEPGRLQSMGSWRGGHDWATSLSFFTFMHWGRKWQPTPVFLPGESQGRGSLVGWRLWGRTESDTTETT